MKIVIYDWLNGKNGQIFLNFAYSWGAAIVILGALFKLTHMPYANLMLFIGMGTEVIVFLISGFESPFMKIGDTKSSGKTNDVSSLMEKNYVEQLDKFGQMIGRLGSVVDALPDNKDNAGLHETIVSIRNMYELQLKSVGSNLAAIDNINNQTKIMAEKMEELNAIYGRMINALKVKE